MQLDNILALPRKITIVSAIVISAVALVTYHPALKIGFINNDWIYLERVVRLNLLQYLAQYFVPGAESGWYRPLFSLLFLIVYALFGANPLAYHLVYVLLHLVNGVLLYALVQKISRKTLIASISTLVYIGLPLYSKAVYWPSTPDTLAMVFYLAAIWFWIHFLETGKRSDWSLTFVSFLLALLTKETSLTLPIVLFLVDRLLVRGQAKVSSLFNRYLPYLLVWLPYLAFEYYLQRSGSYVRLAGYGIGSHMILNLINSLEALAFPWALDDMVGSVWLAITTLVFLWVVIAKRNLALIFLASAAIINLLPVIGFPASWFEMRYLYASAMVSGILLALGIERVWTTLRQPKWFALIASAVIGLLLLANGLGVAEAAGGWSEIARQRAVPFRDIVRQHPVFPEPTKLYFIESRNVSVFDLSVMFLLRYGNRVIVDGTDDNQSNRVAGWQEYPTSYVYYFDETGKPIEVRVTKNVVTQSAPAPPITLAAPIRLEGYEIADNSIKRGNALVLLLYWRAVQQVEQDYSVFVHLVDRDGRMIASHDGPPRGGKSLTSTWKANDFIVDGIVMPIGAEVPTGSNYHLEVGMYSLPKVERLPVIDQNGQRISDKMIIQPIQVTE